MGLLRRYSTALSRHHRSRGFGIHSPSAYRFVTEVLSERCPYYAYDELRALRKSLAHKRQAVTNHEAQLLFRVVNHFAPQCVFQVGAEDPLTTASVLMPSSKSVVYVYDKNQSGIPLTGEMLQRIKTGGSSLKLLVTQYLEAVGSRAQQHFVLVDSLADNDDFESLRTLLAGWLKCDQCVVIMRRLHHSRHMRRLWHACQRSMPHGHTFTNGKLGILVAKRGVPREDYNLWL